jgi:hypothetical protein
MSTSFVIPAPPQASIPVAGESKSFPVRRIWCVGRNYLEHIREMGNDERAPPFFFAKHADMLVPDGASIPYPPLTKDLHHEVELIVAMKSGGLNIPADKACRSPRARKSGHGRSASRSTIPRPAPPCSRPRKSAIPRRARSGSRSMAPNSRRATSPN